MPPPAIRLGPPQPYLKTHGGKVARLHRFDWAVLLLLVAADVGLNLIEPFHRFVGEDMLTDLRYPLKSNTVPVWAVPMYAVIGPIIVFVGVYLKRRNVYDMHHAILGLLFSVLITGVLTDAIKDGVGRPRPNFFWRCFPNGVPKYDNITGGVLCAAQALTKPAGGHNHDSRLQTQLSCKLSLRRSSNNIVPDIISKLLMAD
jgi:hypothetical protein